METTLCALRQSSPDYAGLATLRMPDGGWPYDPVRGRASSAVGQRPANSGARHGPTRRDRLSLAEGNAGESSRRLPSALERHDRYPGPRGGVRALSPGAGLLPTARGQKAGAAGPARSGDSLWRTQRGATFGFRGDRGEGEPLCLVLKHSGLSLVRRSPEERPGRVGSCGFGTSS